MLAVLSTSCDSGAPLLKIQVFWDVMPYRMVEIASCIRGTWCCHLHKSKLQGEMEVEMERKEQWNWVCK
jgi:hypothetical protein